MHLFGPTVVIQLFEEVYSNNSADLSEDFYKTGWFFSQYTRIYNMIHTSLHSILATRAYRYYFKNENARMCFYKG